MKPFSYLQLQPIDDPIEDAIALDIENNAQSFAQDDTIDLTQDEDEESLDREWDQVMKAMHSDMDITE